MALCYTPTVYKLLHWSKSLHFLTCLVKVTQTSVLSVGNIKQIYLTSSTAALIGEVTGEHNLFCNHRYPVPHPEQPAKKRNSINECVYLFPLIDFGSRVHWEQRKEHFSSFSLSIWKGTWLGFGGGGQINSVQQQVKLSAGFSQYPSVLLHLGESQAITKAREQITVMADQLMALIH